MSLRAEFRVALLLALACALAVPAFSQAANNNIVTNANFSYPGNPGYDWTYNPAAAGHFFFYTTFGPAVAAFGGYAPGYYDTISQTLTTQPGKTYTLTFDLANTYDPVFDFYADFRALWNGAVVFDAPGTEANYWDALQPFSVTVEATGTSSTLSFAAYNDPGFYYLTESSVTLDVPVSAPEGGSAPLYLALAAAACAAAFVLNSRIKSRRRAAS
jgi:hypothetical protein